MYHNILCDSILNPNDERVDEETHDSESLRSDNEMINNDGAAGDGDDGSTTRPPTRKLDQFFSSVASMAKTAEIEGAVLLRRLAFSWDKKPELN